MIRIGYNDEQKRSAVREYVREHGISKVYVLYWRDFRIDYRCGCDVEYVEYKDIIEYPVFYRLIEEIGDDSLLVMDELMRTQNRGELTYNCAHHYCNQTDHKIVFERFPFIEKEKDFMILLDFIDKGRFKGKSFSFNILRGEDVIILDNPIESVVEYVQVSDKQRERYRRKKENLFKNLGQKDPDTIPRNLHVYVGNWKKPYIDTDVYYIARNGRFRLDNVATYRIPNLENRLPGDRTVRVLDFPHRRIDFNDYIKLTNAEKVVFISTGMPVDNYYLGEFEKWLERKNSFAQRGSCI